MGDSKRGLPDKETAPQQQPANDTLARELKTRQQETYSLALFYCQKGWPIIPLQPGGKEPLWELLPKDQRGKVSWKLLALRPPSRPEVEDWLQRFPGLNIGLATGQASGVVVLDVDDRDKLPQGLYLPPTVLVETGRGFHYWYAHSGPLTGRAFDWGEVKGDGGYVLIPPSTHPSGAQYMFLTDSPLDEMEDAPSWVLDGRTETGRTSGGPSGPILSHTAGRTRINSDTSSPPLGVLVKDVLETADLRTQSTWYREYEAAAMLPEVAFAVLRLCGREVDRMGKAFLCPMPEHHETRPSAALYQKPGRPIVLTDFHNKGGDKDNSKGFMWPLPDVYAAVMTGEARFLSAAERPVWWIRALHQAGYIELPLMKVPEPPQDAPRAAQRVFQGFLYLLRCRRAYDREQNREAPFSWGFAVGWCGISSKATVSKGMEWLLKHRYLRVTQRGSRVGDKGRRRSTFFALARPR